MLVQDSSFWFYFAGFMDGEGTVFLRRLKRDGVYSSYQAGLQIVNTNKDVIFYIQTKIGVGTVREHAPRKEGNKPYWIYGVYDRNCLDVFKAVVDKLKIKRLQVETVIEFYETTFTTPKGYDIPDEVIEQRNVLVDRMKVLNN